MIRWPRLPRNTNTCPPCGSRFSVSWISHRQAVEALAHVRIARCQPYPNAGRYRDHRSSSTAITRLSAAASTHGIDPDAPAADKLDLDQPAVRHRGGSCNRQMVQAVLSERSAVWDTGFTILPPPPNSRRQRNRRLAATPCLRAIEDTDAAAVSATIASFSARDHLRRVSATIAKRLSWLCPDIGTAQVLISDQGHIKTPIFSRRSPQTRRGSPDAYVEELARGPARRRRESIRRSLARRRHREQSGRLDRSAATKVTVFQWPRGTAAIEPLTAPASAIAAGHVGGGPGFINKDQFFGNSELLWLAIQSRRAWAMSGRSCSAACCDFFCASNRDV